MATAELASDLAMALDPVVFAEHIGIAPDPWQRNVLRSTAPRILLNCCRQSGKSTTTAVLVCHTALYQPGSLILILSPGERQSKETFRKVMDVYNAFEHPVSADAETKLELELANGSRIVALPGNEARVRGYSGVRLLVIDEASRVDDALYASVRPMLAVSHGRLIALSTPWGKRGFWYEAWISTQPWERVKITALDCPRISQAFLEEERAAVPSMVYNAEYLCEFTDTVDSVFAYEQVIGALSADVQPLFGGV